MVQEWARNDTWTDWVRHEHSASREWEYVTMPVADGAQRQEGSGVGGRDAGHDGFTVQEPCVVIL